MDMMQKSTGKNTSGFDADRIMNEIRREAEEKNIREVTDPFTGIPLTRNVTPEMANQYTESLKLKSRIRELNNGYAIGWNPPKEGGIRKLLRRLVWALGKLVVLPVMEEQNRVNAEMTRCLNSAYAQLEYQKHYIEILEEQLQSGGQEDPGPDPEHTV